MGDRFSARAPVERITSRHNPVVDEFRTLASTPDPMGERLLLDGIHLVRDARDAGLLLETVAVSDTRAAMKDEASDLIDGLRSNGTRVLVVSESVANAISPVRTPTGLTAIARRQPHVVPAICEHPRALIVVAFSIQDPGNLGSLVRATEAAGATGLLVTGTSANPFSWKALRGSMGSALRLPIATNVPVPSMLTSLRTFGVSIVAALPRDGQLPDDVDWRGRVALLLGGEGSGLEPSLISAADQRVTIPMTPPVESLNVAAAGAVLLYAARRQRS